MCETMRERICNTCFYWYEWSYVRICTYICLSLCFSLYPGLHEYICICIRAECKYFSVGLWILHVHAFLSVFVAGACVYAEAYAFMCSRVRACICTCMFTSVCKYTKSWVYLCVHLCFSDYLCMGVFEYMCLSEYLDGLLCVYVCFFLFQYVSVSLSVSFWLTVCLTKARLHRDASEKRKASERTRKWDSLLYWAYDKQCAVSTIGSWKR